MGWSKETYELPEGHGWKAKPGHKILVLDAGAVLLEYPADWVVEPGPGHMEIRDGASLEESNCVLAVSYLRLPIRDWSDVPLSGLLLKAAEGDDRERIDTGAPIEGAREDLELVWMELRLVDPGEHRQCRSRLCLARGREIQCLITFDFWPEDAERLTPVWDGVVASLRVEVDVEDPTGGRRLE